MSERPDCKFPQAASRTAYGKGCRCSACCADKADRARTYYERNREKVLAQQRDRYERNREKVLAQQREYGERNREKISAKRRERYDRNRAQGAARSREYYERNREKVLAQQREYGERNREKISKRNSDYRERNREKINAHKRAAYARDREMHAEQRKDRRKVDQRRQEFSSTRAHRSGMPWEPHEDRIVLDPSLTMLERALLTGRTTVAVRCRADHLRNTARLRERRNARWRERYASDPEFRERAKARARAHRAAA